MTLQISIVALSFLLVLCMHAQAQCQNFTAEFEIVGDPTFTTASFFNIDEQGLDPVQIYSPAEDVSLCLNDGDYILFSISSNQSTTIVGTYFLDGKEIFLDTFGFFTVSSATSAPSSSPTASVFCDSDELLFQIRVHSTESQVGWDLFEENSTSIADISSGSTGTTLICLNYGDYLFSILDSSLTATTVFALYLDEKIVYASNNLEFSDVVSFSVSNLTSSTECSTNQCQWSINFIPDSRPEEVSWSLRSLLGTENSLGDFAFPYNYSTCLEYGQYRLIVADAGDNGLCCSYGIGSYSVDLEDTTIASGSQFGSEATTNFACSELTAAPTAGPTPGVCSCPSGWTNDNSFSGYCFKWFHSLFLNFADASDYCVNSAGRPARLATFRSPAALSVAHSISTSQNWVGLVQNSSFDAISPAAGWSWFDLTFSYDESTTGWAPFQPNDIDDVQHCGGLHNSGLADYDCDLLQNGVICETECVSSPTVAPTQSPSIAPTKQPTICAENECLFEVFIYPDEKPEETAWSLVSSLDVLNFNATNSSMCLPSDVYGWVITDSGNDGMCCSFGHGSYELYFDNELRFYGGNFTSSASHTFTINKILSPTAAPSAAPSFIPTCNSDQALVFIAITPDNDPGSISWSFVDFVSSDLIATEIGGRSGAFCVEEGFYLFQIVSPGGLCCDNGEGSFQILVDDEVVASGSNFSGNSVVIPITISLGTEFPTMHPSVSPSTSPTPECNVTSNCVLDAVITSSDPSSVSYSYISQSPPAVFNDLDGTNASLCLPPDEYTFFFFQDSTNYTFQLFLDSTLISSGVSPSYQVPQAALESATFNCSL